MSRPDAVGPGGIRVEEPHDQVCDEVGGHDGADKNGATHGGCAALDLVACGTVLADDLPVSLA